MQAAESSPRKPPRKSQWSPALRNAGIIRQYWKIRLHDANQATNHSSRILRLEDQIRQHDPSFHLPFKDVTLSLDEIRRNLTQSSKLFRTIQRKSDEYRMRSLYDLLALYESGASSLSTTEETARAKIIRATIRNETTRGVFGNLRRQINLSEQTGFNFINVPSETLSPSSTQSAYQHLQSNTTNPILWEKVVDKEAINAQLLTYNCESFRAASASPCGHRIIYDELSFTSLSPAAEQLLAGHIPPHWPTSGSTSTTSLPCLLYHTTLSIITSSPFHGTCWSP